VGIAQHISATERRAQLAERDALERYLTAFLADRVGARFAGRVAGVTRFGLFVELDETGANGLIPASTLGHGRPRHDAERHVLAIGRRAVRLGEQVEVELAEADRITGSLVFALLSHEGKPWPAAPAGPLGGGRGRRRPAH
jgi:ribonuclease R